MNQSGGSKDKPKTFTFVCMCVCGGGEREVSPHQILWWTTAKGKKRAANGRNVTRVTV